MHIGAKNMKAALWILLFTMFCHDAFPQSTSALDGNCSHILNGTYGVIAETYQERNYQINVNEDNIGVLMTWPQPNPPVFPGNLDEIQGDLASAVEIFRQHVMRAADRWGHTGSGTLVWAGDTNENDLPALYALDPIKCDTARILVTIETDAFKNPSNLAGQVQSIQTNPAKCVYFGSDGKKYSRSVRLVIFTHTRINNQVSKIDWDLTENGNLAGVLLHEFGHTYNTEHAPFNIPSVMNGSSGRLTEYDARCIRWRGFPRQYKAYGRTVTQSGVGSEFQLLPNGVENVASGKYKDGTWFTNTMIYEDTSVTVGNQGLLNWYKNIFINDYNQMQTLNNIYNLYYTTDLVQSSSFQVWREHENNEFHVYSTFPTSTGTFDRDWIINYRVSNASDGNWYNWALRLNHVIDAHPYTKGLVSEYPPAITWDALNQKTLFVWNDYIEGKTFISSGYQGGGASVSVSLNKPKNISGNISKNIPPSATCNSNGICILVYVMSSVTPGGTSWKDLNLIKIGRLNLSEINSSTVEQTYLTHPANLPSLFSGSLLMRTTTQPVSCFDGAKFWIFFRGSYWPLQRLNAFYSTDGITWTYSSTFDSRPFGGGLGGSSYSSTGPSISSYFGCSSLLYSRP